jgi:3-hydroxybutyryl-CoA dehydrogenase
MCRTPAHMEETLGIVGSGAIATGLAAAAAQHGEVVLWARSDNSADRARAAVDKACGKMTDVDAARITVVQDLDALSNASAIVEAVVEDVDTKAELWGRLSGLVHGDALLGSTTSSLSVATLAQASGAPERFVGLHVFNPVTKMDLVELVFPEAATQATRDRAFALCEQLGKTAVEVPDLPGFVVNRLLFPFLFEAVRLREETDLEPAAVDACLQLGAGHPMGPLALLDLVGLDVAQSIGRTIGADVPPRIDALVQEGALGRKTGRGFYTY